MIIKQGDTRHALKAKLSNVDGDADLSSINFVKFRMANTRFKNVIEREVDVIDVAQSTVVVVFTDDEVKVADKYFGEFVVQYADGKNETYPNSGYIEIEIQRNLKE